MHDELFLITVPVSFAFKYSLLRVLCFPAFCLKCFISSTARRVFLSTLKFWFWTALVSYPHWHLHSMMRTPGGTYFRGDFKVILWPKLGTWTNKWEGRGGLTDSQVFIEIVQNLICLVLLSGNVMKHILYKCGGNIWSIHEGIRSPNLLSQIKTSPQAKRHKPSLLFTSLTILTFITRQLSSQDNFHH